MTSPESRPAPSGRRPVLGPRARICVLALVMAAVAGVLLHTAVPDAPPVEPPVAVPWLFMVLAFALAEAAVVHVHLYRESHSFSLTELVLVIGLYLLDPVMLVAALVVGAGAVFALRRRHGPVKLAFNLALYALAGSLATIAYAAMVDGGDPAGPRGWVAALAAVLVATVTSDLMIFVALSTSVGRVDLRQIPQMMMLSVPFTMGTTSLALVGMRTLWSDPAALLLLLVPAMLMLLAYRAFHRARRERTNMAFLHEISSMLHRGGDLESALLEFLAASRSMFRASVAELTLVSSNGEVTTTRSVDDSEPVVLDTSCVDGQHATLQRLVGQGGVVRTVAGSVREADPASRYADARGLKDMMAIAVTGDRLHGILLIADRHTEVSTFDEADAALFETLAQQVGQVLDNGHLERSLARVTELKEELAYRASHDSLTGLANRAHFIERTLQAMGEFERTDVGTGPSVLYLDLDGFKAVNDSLGHEHGDVLLEVVADRLRGCVRTDDLLARLGGDEFGVLIPAGQEQLAAVTTAERIVDRLSQPIDLGGRLVTIGTSVGVATATAGTTVNDLVRQADAAMYVAKNSGGRAHAVYAEDLGRGPQPRYTATDLARAIDGNQIVTFYQPIMDLASGKIVGAEALVRWQHPTDGLLPPEAFVPLAEQSRLITRIGRLVLDQACRDASRWSEVCGAGDLFVTVNLSAVQLADPTLVDDVAGALRLSGLDPRSLLLEITETMLMRDMHAAADALARLKRLGTQLAIDDFGTGYSSLAYLRRFPVDMLKIAREFTSGIDTDSDDDAVTHAIIQLATTLGLRTVAEGIETAAQHAHLTGLRCALGQGFLFSQPVDADRILKLLTREGATAAA